MSISHSTAAWSCESNVLFTRHRFLRKRNQKKKQARLWAARPSIRWDAALAPGAIGLYAQGEV